MDNFYADLANKVFECIKNSGIADAFDEDKEVMKDVAIHLTMYLEDLASEIGVWRAATTEFRKRYGSLLPFYELGDDYEEGFVNREDVRFLLWNEAQCYRGFESFINPENIGIEQVASEIFDLRLPISGFMISCTTAPLWIPIGTPANSLNGSTKTLLSAPTLGTT